MWIQRRTNLLWGLVFLGAAVAVFLRALNVLPEGIYDLLARAWPALLVLVGLAIFLRERVPVGELIAVVASVALVAGVTSLAFSNRATQERDAYQETINQPVGAGISLLRLQVSALATDVELVRSLSEGAVTGQFIGSTESKIVVEYLDEGDTTARLTVKETQPNEFPLLEAVGRGTLRLELPAGVVLDVDFRGKDGTVSLNMSDLALERLNVALDKGDALVTLPQYKPLGSPPDATLGVLSAGDGDLTLFVPAAVAVRLENVGLSAQPPQYDPNQYNLLANGTLETRNYDTFETRLRYVATAARGQVMVAQAGGE